MAHPVSTPPRSCLTELPTPRARVGAWSVVVALVCAVALLPPTLAHAKDQAKIVAGEVAAFATALGVSPESAIDLTGISGAYCFNADIGKGGHMTHYAVDPSATVEDLIDFVNAKPLMDAGADFSGLPQHPGTLGSMTPYQWYFLPARAKEPHHNRRFPFPLLIRATNLP